ARAMIEALMALVGLVVGGAVAWILARGHFRSVALVETQARESRLAVAESLGDELRKQLSQRDLEAGDLRGTLQAERALRAQAEARAEATRENIEEQKRLLEGARERLAETFKALSADALRQSTSAFLEQARETIDGQLARRQEALDGLVKPLQESLRRYEAELRQLEATRQQAYGSLEEQLKTLNARSAELQRETGSLVTALRSPQVRGRWGELTLRRAAELAGMTPYCDYLEQVTVEGEGGRLRPDMIVRLPSGRTIVVDAKVPLNAYLDATTAATEDERARLLGRHAQQVRQHLAVLAARGYWEQLDDTVELVVMFIPGEAFVGAAMQADARLLEDGMAKKILIATPTTLIGLLLAIAHGWQQERLAVNAAQISELGRLLYERLRTLAGHVEDVGDKLGRAVHAYNAAVGSMESRVLPAARRFRDLGAAGGEEIPVLEAVDERPRTLTAPDVPEQLRAPDLPA
ncbi:MAG: DNA recombination protein RmuC, partial [Candidatus Rokuibacteriota bacterium]